MADQQVVLEYENGQQKENHQEEKGQSIYFMMVLPWMIAAVQSLA